MKKHNDKLKAQMFEDGITPAISLNPVLKEVVCDLNIGDKVYTEGWGYKLDGKDWIIEDIKEAIGISESGFLVKINGYYNYIDSTWLNKRGVKADIIRRSCAGDTVSGSLPLKWTDEDMVKFAEGFKNYTDNPTGKEALEIWKDWIELKDSGLDKPFVFNSNDRNKIKMKPQIILTTETEVFQQADIMSSIRQLQTVMKDWQDTLKNNSIDGDVYSRGLLIGYEAAMRQVDNWLGEYYS